MRCLTRSSRLVAITGMSVLGLVSLQTWSASAEILPVALDASRSASSSDHWSVDFSAPGPSGTITTVITFRGELIVAGNFKFIGSLSVGNIASWDGSAWHALGEGTNGDVQALAIYNDELIAAGSFTSIDGISANRIARWDGNAWSALGDGADANVHCLAEYADTLYVGGNFSRAGGIPVQGIARWDGTSWKSAGVPRLPSYRIGFSNLIVVDGKLIGNWSVLPGEDSLITWNAFFATWDGRNWSGIEDPPPYGVPLQPMAMVLHNDSLYATGYWDDREYRVARLDGSHWVPVGPELAEYPTQLASYQGRLILAQARWLGHSPRGFLSEWTGTEWMRVDPGPEGNVFGLGGFNGDLIAGGDFGFDDGPAVRGIGAWDGQVWRSVGEFPGRGCDGEINVIGTSPGTLVVSGRLRHAGVTPVDDGGLWDGAGWRAIPASRTYHGLWYFTRRIAIFDSEIYAGGPCGDDHWSHAVTRVVRIR